VTLCPPIEPAPTLLSAPIELAGNWGHMLPRSADLVIERSGIHASTASVSFSDRQPTGVIRHRDRVDKVIAAMYIPTGYPGAKEN
jgi:hypothetical protein